LEKIAQALFKRWFVEFEFPDKNGKPYKSSGGKMIPSELGDIPEGWRVLPLDELSDFLNGLALQKYPPEDEENHLPVIKIKELKNGITESTDKASNKIDPKYIIDYGDVIFSWSGSLEIALWNNGKGALNQHLFKVSSNRYPKWLYYYWVKAHMPNFKQIAHSKATTMGHIQRHHLSESLCLVPEDDQLKQFSDIQNPLISKIINNHRQINDLTHGRDTLLPKLMSGQLRIGK